MTSIVTTMLLYGGGRLENGPQIAESVRPRKAFVETEVNWTSPTFACEVNLSSRQWTSDDLKVK